MAATFSPSSADRSCSGPSRRDLLGLGLTAASGLTLPGILRLRAAAGETSWDTAVIFVMLGGGASQLETYDPKPEAPAEYRGPVGSIRTAVPGIRFSELFPRQAGLMRELAVVRSVHHHEASHIALHAIETGYFLRNRGNALRGEMPAVGSVVARLRPVSAGALPPFVSMPQAQAYSSPGHLGGQYAAFNVNGNPAADDFQVANLVLRKGLTPGLLRDRQTLLHSFDAAARALDGDDVGRAIDAFRLRALDLLNGERARAAFDLHREPAALRDRYGRSDFGQRLLLARRLTEAGVPFVLVRTFDWDDHQGLEARMRTRAPAFDTGMAALVEDLRQRGRSRDVLVVAMGEFGRTPRVNQAGGRDHWPAVASVLLAGGRYGMGQVIGASDTRGGAVARSPYLPQNVLGMVYRHLGIDPAHTFPDLTGRPRHVLEERAPIAELL